MKHKALFYFILSIFLFTSFYCVRAHRPEISLSRPGVNENRDQLSRVVSPDLEILKSKSEKLIGLILDEKPREIGNMVHPEKTVFVDIKAEFTRDELLQQWSNRESALYALYWNTPLYRKISEDPGVRCFRDILRGASKITLKIELGRERASVWLDFPGRPSPMEMGELIFEKSEGRWFLRKLF